MALITSAQAAEKLGISVRRVQELIKNGRLPSQQFGRTYVVNEDDLKLVEDRKPGRPRKATGIINGEGQGSTKRTTEN
ncbi:MAG: helix-turn-helix domain-containing protein [Chitinophagaceae bacterium]